VNGLPEWKDFEADQPMAGDLGDSRRPRRQPAISPTGDDLEVEFSFPS
jgi:hypothetical protein